MGFRKKHPLVHLKMKQKFHRARLNLCAVHSVFYGYFTLSAPTELFQAHSRLAAGSLRSAALGDGCYLSRAPPGTPDSLGTGVRKDQD